MAQLLRLGSVARSYIIGWNRSIGEIFAEDYAQLALPGSPHQISWLGSPNDTVIAALKADLGLGPEPEIVAPPLPKPVVRTRSGSLAAGKRVTIPFGLLGPGRNVQVTANFGGATVKVPRATLEVRCDGTRMALKTIATGVDEGDDRAKQRRPGRVHRHARRARAASPGASPLTVRLSLTPVS